MIEHSWRSTFCASFTVQFRREGSVRRSVLSSKCIQKIIASLEEDAAPIEPNQECIASLEPQRLPHLGGNHDLTFGIQNNLLDLHISPFKHQPRAFRACSG